MIRRLVATATVGALISAPWLLDQYLISTGARVLAIGLLTVSVAMLTGIAGLPTLGHAAYFGVGAYTTAILARGPSQLGIGHLLVAGLAAATLAVAVGTAAVRARGIVFLMISLAVGELAHSVAIQWTAVTGGSDGLGGVPAVVPVWGAPALHLDGLRYLWALGVVLVGVGLVRLLIRSPLGLAVDGIRDNEDRIRALGYPVNRHLLTWYTISGAVAGVAGAVWVHVQGYVSPADLGFQVSAMALIAALVGGPHSVWGGLAGTALVVLLRDWVTGLVEPLSGHGPLLLGLAFILTVYLMPRGLAGLVRSGRRPAAVTEVEAG